MCFDSFHLRRYEPKICHALSRCLNFFYIHLFLHFRPSTNSTRNCEERNVWLLLKLKKKKTTFYQMTKTDYFNDDLVNRGVRERLSL